MFRTAFGLTALALAFTVTLSAQAAKKYGTALTLKDTTKVSDIYAAPEKFKGKRVRVEGTIVEVCEEMGCWLAIASDKEFQTLRFKVEDGVIVFPMSAKGLHATLEGVVDVGAASMDEPGMKDKMKTMSAAELAKHQKEMAKVTIQIKGEGAEIR